MGQFIYCYDAYCSWCFGFGPVVKKIFGKYKSTSPFEVFSGGMILPEQPKHIHLTAAFIKKSYRDVEELAGVEFGADYLWHINNPEESDWFPDSTKPAIALCIFKEIYPDLQVVFAGELQAALFIEGRDLCDNEAYRHLLDKYHIDADKFYAELKSEEYMERAQYEFALVKQLQVTGFPVLLYQESETKFHLVAKGYTAYEIVDDRIQKLFQSLNV